MAEEERRPRFKIDPVDGDYSITNYQPKPPIGPVDPLVPPPFGPRSPMGGNPEGGSPSEPGATGGTNPGTEPKDPEPKT